MLNTATLDKLAELNLTGMAAALADQLEHPAPYAELDFAARLGLLADREGAERDNRRLERNLKAAKLRQNVAVEQIDFAGSRGRDRTQLLHLAEAGWVAEHRDLIVVGPTGAGKTFLACALAHAACRRGYRALYLRLPRALDELSLARADGRLARLLAAYSRVDVLVCDDLALRPLPAEQAADLLEIIDDRHRRRSTIVTSQLPVADWHTALGEPTLADAICDRLVHAAHRIELRGESMRKPASTPPATAKP